MIFCLFSSITNSCHRFLQFRIHPLLVSSCFVLLSFLFLRPFCWQQYMTSTLCPPVCFRRFMFFQCSCQCSSNGLVCQAALNISSILAFYWSLMYVPLSHPFAPFLQFCLTPPLFPALQLSDVFKTASSLLWQHLCHLSAGLCDRRLCAGSHIF